METNKITGSKLERLLARLGGTYLSWTNFTILFISDIAGIIGVIYIVLITNLNDHKISTLIVILSIFLTLTNIFITQFIFLATKNCRGKLDNHFYKIRKTRQSQSDISDDKAWQEIFFLPSRMVIISFISHILLFILPTIIVFISRDNLVQNQLIHFIIGLSVSAISIIIVYNSILDIILTPIRQIHDWPVMTPQKSPVLSRLSTRFLGMVIFLVTSTIVIFVGLGMQRSINASLPGADILFEISQFQTESFVMGSLILVFGIIIGILNASSISRQIHNLLHVMRRIQGGDFHHLANIITSDESSLLANQLNNYITHLNLASATNEKSNDAQISALKLRTNQLQTITKIFQEIAGSKDTSSLLDNVVQLISQNFGFYHVGIYLSDANGEYAVLQASSSEGGKVLMTRGYKCAMNQNNPIGRSIINNKVVLIQDTAQDLSFQVNPDLPQTKSLIVFPLAARGLVIGALDIQTTTSIPINEEDHELLRTLADQITLTIINIRLVEENRLSLQRLETSFENNIQHIWDEFSQSNKIAYRYTPTSVTKFESFDSVTEKIGSIDSEHEYLSLPIALHGQKIGSIDIFRTGHRVWDENEKTFLNEVSNQIGLALENARLLNSTKQRVYFEETLSHLTARLGLSIDTNTILETAIRELHKLPDVTEVSIKLNQPDVNNPTND